MDEYVYYFMAGAAFAVSLIMKILAKILNKHSSEKEEKK